ncbi:hypothetical protein CRG98_014155 [Punica granatum]|uniref:Uncharacterized protein n=1 Tax=Punica granatum TaxID=22663 RepID=A0A2I0KCC3_PUNGR|nr:hypothetical protein CRG98_014155 [Punica granatum]
MIRRHTIRYCRESLKPHRYIKREIVKARENDYIEEEEAVFGLNRAKRLSATSLERQAKEWSRDGVFGLSKLLMVCGCLEDFKGSRPTKQSERKREKEGGQVLNTRQLDRARLAREEQGEETRLDGDQGRERVVGDPSRDVGTTCLSRGKKKFARKPRNL